MLPLDRAFRRPHWSRLKQRMGFAQHLAQHLDIAAPIDEADVLAVFFVPDREPEGARTLSHFALGQIAERKEGMADHLRGNAPEHVALVLIGIRGTLQKHRLFPVDRAGSGSHIVAGRDPGVAVPARPGEKGAELDVGVALHAGIGSSPTPILGREVVQDSLAEEIHHVEHGVRDSESRRHRLRVPHAL